MQRPLRVWGRQPPTAWLRTRAQTSQPALHRGRDHAGGRLPPRRVEKCFMDRARPHRGGTLPPMARAESAQFLCPTPVPHTATNPRFLLKPLFLLLPRPDLSSFSSETAALSSLPAQLFAESCCPRHCPPTAHPGPDRRWPFPTPLLSHCQQPHSQGKRPKSVWA